MSKEIKKLKNISLVRSSAAGYLTFVAAGGGSEGSVEMHYEDENIWMTQRMMEALYNVTVPAINQHLRRINEDNELTREATVKQYLIVQTEGNREVRREVEHYSLQAIIAVGIKIENERAVQFRKWATQIFKDYTIQGWTMDVDRLKHGGTLTDEFSERQLEKNPGDPAFGAQILTEGHRHLPAKARCAGGLEEVAAAPGVFGRAVK
jgi:hypothetical protein